MSFKDLIPWRRERQELPVQRMGARDDWGGGSGLAPLFRDDPFFQQAGELFDRVFQGFGGAMAPFGGERGLGLSLDLRETDEAFHVSAELPGVDEKDVEVSISGGQLVIRGEKRDEREEERAGRHRTERVYGRFERSLTLPAEVDEERVRAECRRGVLEITLPKTQRARSAARRIPIQRG